MPYCETTLVQALTEVLGRQDGRPVEVMETHISWVLLTPLFAYKLKKPVKLPFVDFSSLGMRRHFCEEELRLNRRFAPELYLDVQVLGGSLESLWIGGAEIQDPIDYLVRMRRFPQSVLLSNLLAEGDLKPTLLDDLASRLAAWHAAAPVSTSMFGDPGQIADTVTGVLASLEKQGADDRLTHVQEWVETTVHMLRPTLSARQRTGFIRECHGDLHSGNIALMQGALLPFDCVEFDPQLRWIDVVSDVAFLMMDLTAHQREDLAFRFLDRWLVQTGDHAALLLLRFYEVYRALVRSLTSQLYRQNVKAICMPDYLACAVQLASLPQGRARLMITHGVSGSGKSLIAGQLVGVAHAVHIRSDVERKRLFGLGPLAHSAAQGLEIYSVQANASTLESLLRRARDSLSGGYPVIVDATFLDIVWRRRFQALAAELNLPFSILQCQASESVLRHRVTARNASGSDASEANLSILDRQLSDYKPLAIDEQMFAIVVSTEDDVDIAWIDVQWRLAA